jgi:uncharacterized membrane protein
MPSLPASDCTTITSTPLLSSLNLATFSIRFLSDTSPLTSTAVGNAFTSDSTGRAAANG